MPCQISTKNVMNIRRNNTTCSKQAIMGRREIQDPTDKAQNLESCII
jgi:hypothetical protein